MTEDHRTQTEPVSLQDRLGLVVDPALLERALTHRSYAYENGGLPTNERLEFLGDSVLGLVVTDTLYRRHAEQRGRDARSPIAATEEKIG